MGHRRFLPARHRLRTKGAHFGGTADHRSRPALKDGKRVYEMIKNVKVVHGKGPGSQPVPKDADGHAPLFKKKSIFWDLPYWEDLEVRNAIDVMHLTKNLCLNLLGFMGCYGQSKDTLEARRDLKEMQQRDGLHPEKRGKGEHYLRPASYTLSKEEKESMFEFLNSIKVPSGYSANMKGIINMKEKKFTNLKAHDCHMLMTQLLPVALRGILPENVRLAIVKLCAFMNAISQKAIDMTKLGLLQVEVAQCLVSFEMVFPPSFFNIMTHLLIHLCAEIHILGPVYLHNMWPFERFMAVLKHYVLNRARPEGCIAKGYATEEVIEFCIEFIDSLKPIGVPTSRHEGRLRGKGTLGRKAALSTNTDLFYKAHSMVLHQSKEVAEFVVEHKMLVIRQNPLKSNAWIQSYHLKNFPSWLQNRLESNSDIPNVTAWLARGPSSTIVKWQGYEVNGYTFYTMDRDKKSTNQNSGVRQESTNNDGKKDMYYGQIEEIWELNYGIVPIALFRCRWILLSAVTKDEYGMTLVDLSKTGYTGDPFVFANDVQQVFYVKDMGKKTKANAKEPGERHIVLPGKRKIVGVEDKTDKSDDYDQLDGMAPFEVKIDPSIRLDAEEAPYLRHDHDQGTFVRKKFYNVIL